VDAETGEEVDASDIIKGYEVGKGQYIEIEPEEHEAIAIETKRTIEIDEFVPKKEIDELYLNSPFYLAPDGEVGQQAFAVIREAIRKEGMVALGRVVFTSREHVIALEARGKGLLGITLRYPLEAPKERAPAKVINLMDALRRSVETERGGSAKRQATSEKARGSESERPKKKKSR
jgi:DNA end-binding protein Ku